MEDLDWLEGSPELDSDSGDRTIDAPQSELLTLKLLRQAIISQNPDDAVMNDFAQYVLPNLLSIAIGVTAKGGQFFENLDRSNAAAGKPKVRRDNATDQSLNTHILNGLFPANAIQQRLASLDTSVRRLVREKERRLVLAAFILHDFEKFPDAPDDCHKLELAEHRPLINDLVLQLGIDKFINPDLPSDYLNYTDDLLCIAYNTHLRWDTNWNFSEFGLQPTLKDRTLRCLTDLTCLADSLSSIVKHPQDAENYRLKSRIYILSDGKLTFTYHSISENRGVLTNIINNSLMEAHSSLNYNDATFYQTLLYLPTGVIYLTTPDAPKIDRSELGDRVVANIKKLCAGQLRLKQTGFGRDGKGMKYADYYHLFFNLPELMQVALDATLRILRQGKASVAGSRSENLVKFQERDVLSSLTDFTFADDLRIDRIAEFGDLISRKIWGEFSNRIEQQCKQNKKLDPAPKLDLVAKVAEFWGLSQYLMSIREIQQINERLKELKLKGNTGGVPYEWYFLAAKYLQHQPGTEDVRPLCQELIEYLVALMQPILDRYQLPDGWNDIKDWVQQVVMLPSSQVELEPTMFLQELNSYNNAKKIGRGKQAICSVSHSAYGVTEQMESAVLFTPQVYTNKQMLGGSNAKRNISSIAGMEMMLRQILMNQTQAVGKKFEDGKYRYLYFYPTYYFTPETNKFLSQAYGSIAQTRFNAELRNHFIGKNLEANWSKDNYQHVDAFLLDTNLAQQQTISEEDAEAKPESDVSTRIDRTFKLAYPEDMPLTFYFMALPPGKDPTDTESWIMPSWLALALPMILDVKTVVSESPIPPFNDGAEFEETVFIDSAPQAIRTILGIDRLRLDRILKKWTDDSGKARAAPLNALTAAYTIHLDVNAKRGKSGYDANWGKFAELARDLETSPLYVYSYLAKWGREQKSDFPPRIEKIRLYAYHLYPCLDPYVEFNHEELTVNALSPMNHPQKLTELYRCFYRAKQRYNPKANAVLKPIDLAAETLLKAEFNCFQGEALIAVVAAEISKLMDRVHGKTADGRWIFKNREEERQAILEFAKYFVEDVFEKAFMGDRARLAGRQLNLIRSTCEFLYRLADDKENHDSKQTEPEEPDDSDE
jgi:CRISPR-associated protein Csc3